MECQAVDLIVFRHNYAGEPLGITSVKLLRYVTSTWATGGEKISHSVGGAKTVAPRRKIARKGSRREKGRAR